MKHAAGNLGADVDNLQLVTWVKQYIWYSLQLVTSKQQYSLYNLYLLTLEQQYILYNLQRVTRDILDNMHMQLAT